MNNSIVLHSAHGTIIIDHHFLRHKLFLQFVKTKLQPKWYLKCECARSAHENMFNKITWVQSISEDYVILGDVCTWSDHDYRPARHLFTRDVGCMCVCVCVNTKKKKILYHVMVKVVRSMRPGPPNYIQTITTHRYILQHNVKWWTRYLAIFFCIFHHFIEIDKIVISCGAWNTYVNRKTNEVQLFFVVFSFVYFRCCTVENNVNYYSTKDKLITNLVLIGFVTNFL